MPEGANRKPFNEAFPESAKILEEESSNADKDFEPDPATQDIKNSIGKQVTLGLARGPTVRGRLIAFDPRFRRVKVQRTTNKSIEETWVNLGYVITVSIVTGETERGDS